MDYKALMDAKKAEDAIKESKVSLTKKIEEALQEIHDFKRLYVEQLASFSCENSPRYERLLKEIVKILT